MLLRQVQARPLQGHHLRALRRRGDAPEGAPRADGAHRPGRAGLAHLVLQGRAEPHRLPARHRPARAREGALLRRLDRHRASTTRRGRRISPTSRTRCAAESEQIYVDRDEHVLAVEERLARRREYFATGKEKSFDEDDEFWTRGLNNWAEDQLLPTLEDTRQLAGGIFPKLAKSLTTEDGKKIRELVRQTATREDRKLAPREIEAVATAAQEIHEALDPLRAELETRDGVEEGRDHEAHPQARRRAHERHGALRRRRRDRGARRREEPRQGARDRQRPARRRPRAGERRPDGRGGARARVRPLPAPRRQEGRPRRRRPVGAEGARDGAGHGLAPRRRPRGGRRRRAPARGDVEAVPRARAEARRQRRAAVPRAQGPVRLAVRLRPVLPRRHGRGGDPRPAPRPRPRRGVASRCAR